MEKKSDDLKKVLEDFTGGIPSFNEVIEKISPKDLDRRRSEGKWTNRQIIHHIADCEIIWSTAIKAALGNPGCTYDFSWYILDNKWADPIFYHSRSIEPAIDLFRGSRGEITELLTLCRDPWTRPFTARHDNLPDGPMAFTVLKAVQWQIRHLDIHLSQIKESLPESIE